MQHNDRARRLSGVGNHSSNLPVSPRLAGPSCRTKADYVCEVPIHLAGMIGGQEGGQCGSELGSEGQGEGDAHLVCRFSLGITHGWGIPQQAKDMRVFVGPPGQCSSLCTISRPMGRHVEPTAGGDEIGVKPACGRRAAGFAPAYPRRAPSLVPRHCLVSFIGSWASGREPFLRGEGEGEVRGFPHPTRAGRCAI